MKKEAEWKGKIQKKFRWFKLRFEWGRFCYIVHPAEGGKDKAWWEWEND